MAWAKLQKVVRDFILGHQQVNGAIANEQAMLDAYNAQHQVAASDGGTIRPAPLPVGRHVANTIPKSVVAVDVTTSSVFGTTHGVADTTLSVGPYANGIERLGVGQYLVRCAYIPATSGAQPWAEWGAQSTGVGVQRLCTAKWNASSGGFVVTTLQNVGGAFTPTDFSFSLSIYSR